MSQEGVRYCVFQGSYSCVNKWNIAEMMSMTKILPIQLRLKIDDEVSFMDVVTQSCEVDGVHVLLRFSQQFLDVNAPKRSRRTSLGASHFLERPSDGMRKVPVSSISGAAC